MSAAAPAGEAEAARLKEEEAAAVMSARESERRAREREAIATPGRLTGPHKTPRRTFGL